MQKTSVHYITIALDFAGQRIDNFLLTYLKGVPKTHIYRLLRKGEVRVNKKRIAPHYKLQAHDVVRLPPVTLPIKNAPSLPSKSLLTLLSERVLYEDNNLLIINKPAGIPVHGGSGVKIGIIEALRYLYPKIPHLELAHRLDADTSGCLLLAKKRSILKELHALLRSGEVGKYYLALTRGQWKKSALRVEAPLRKNHLKSGERIVRVDEKEGKTALTVFSPVEVFTQATLVEAALHTGRTHQIRVHAQYRRHCIAGDPKYGDKEFNKTIREYGLKRLFLHAYRLEFILPSEQQKIKIKAPLDDDLQTCLTALRKNQK